MIRLFDLMNSKIINSRFIKKISVLFSIGFDNISRIDIQLENICSIDSLRDTAFHVDVDQRTIVI